jgi:hypothetical protein
MKYLFLFILFTQTALARNLRDCMDESVATSIASKITAAAQGESGSSTCENVDEHELRDIYQQRSDKMRFANKFVMKYKNSKSIDVSWITPIDGEDPGPLDEAGTCKYSEQMNNKGLESAFENKYGAALKNCPAAATAFKNSLKESKFLYAPLYQLCSQVESAEEKMKQALAFCQPQKSPTEKAEDAPEINRRIIMKMDGNGQRAAQGTQQ